MSRYLLVAVVAVFPAMAAVEPVERFPLPASSIAISRPPEANKPFTVAGERGAFFGRQDGTVEAWSFPVKIFDDLRLQVNLDEYPVPIDVNAYAAHIDVNPSHTTITYSHAAFTIRQHMFAPRGTDAGAPVMLFEIASIRPLWLTLRFTPRMERMWPATNFGRPGAEWVARGTSGLYILHTDNPDYKGAVALARAEPGILAPYQERPKTYPLEFRLRFDPKRDAGRYFPLLAASGASAEQLEQALDARAAKVPALFEATRDYWSHFFDTRLSVETPDADFNRAVRWAAVAIDQARVKFREQSGLVAGYYSSGDSARPGFGWFFGRDTLWTLYAIHSYGDFALSRAALEFLMRRQRDDGKMMHEYSQTADLVDWKATPYYYASADSTPLFVMVMDDYVRCSGDTAFVREHWDEVKRAWTFTRAHDSDGDGIYENTEGTGWVEGWPPKMPHQEIYLAALDAQSAGSMARLAELMGDSALAAAARRKSEEIAGKLESEYYSAEFYAFSRNPDGTLDRTATIYPAVAWWDGTVGLKSAGPMLERWASSEFSTDWGTRDVSPREALYDPLSYHQGSVWPLFTGWVSLAEYRAGRSLSAYAHLMQNADLTYAQDPGAVTELLSGEFFQPFGRSSSHQTWSSAMVLMPAIRGLFGLSWDAAKKRLTLAPHLPATWDKAVLRNLSLGDARFDLEYRRQGDHLVARAPAAVELCSGGKCGKGEIAISLPAVELGIPHGLPAPGSETRGLKVVREEGGVFVLEAPGGSAYALPVRRNGIPGRVEVKFPAGTGYQRVEVR